MDLSVRDHGSHDVDFLWENQSRGPSNSNNSGESKENVKPPNQFAKENEGDQSLVSKKRGKGNAGENDDKNIVSCQGKDGKTHESSHEMRKSVERERRKKIRNMFTDLHALLPQLPSKANQSTIMNEAVKCIEYLQQTLKSLEKQKEERVQSAPFTFGCESSNMVNNSHWQYPHGSSFITDQGSSNYNFSSAMIRTSNSLSTPLEQPNVAFRTWTSANVVLNIFENEAQFCICATNKPGLLTTITYVLEKYNIEVMFCSISRIDNGNTSIVIAHAKRASQQFVDAKTLEEAYTNAAGEITLLVA